MTPACKGPIWHSYRCLVRHWYGSKHEPRDDNYEIKFMIDNMILKLIVLYVQSVAHTVLCKKNANEFQCFSQLFGAFRRSLMKYRVKRNFGRILSNVRNGHCFSQNENSRCSSKAARKFERKVAESRNEFSRTVSPCIERSRENSLQANRGKHHLNL